MVIWYILWPFGIYILWLFDMLYQEKSGNPAWNRPATSDLSEVVQGLEVIKNQIFFNPVSSLPS
jgi:hypothetical protein